MRARLLLIFLACGACSLPAHLPAQAPAAEAAPQRFDLARPEIREFIDDVSRRHRALDRAAVTKLLGQAQSQPRIIELMTRPAERVLPWWEYRQRFLTEERIGQGVEFLQRHRASLERVSATSGVPPEYIVAIIGVETFYGRITGRFRVLDALATLAFDYPPRSRFFRGELEQFMLLVREENIDPVGALGSYAGAMGAPQFIPSSYRAYAVDGSGNRRRDLWGDWEDVFASVANYFREHGWQRGEPVVVPATLDPEAQFVVRPGNLDLDTTLESLAERGVHVPLALPGDTRALLVSAEQQDGPAYRVGFRNFHVITRYNRSVRYAMAVHDLAQEIAARAAPAGR
jgi:membrane-bound lytic murein transglycosylase B